SFRKGAIASRRFWVGGAILAGLVLLQVGDCYRSHPFQLADYSPLIGGPRGARALGFESTYWCDALNDDFLEQLNREIPPDASIAVHALDAQPFREFQLEGVIPQGWRINHGGIPDIHVLQFRQGFFGPFERKLIDSDFEVVAESSLDGVPLVRAYRRIK
ncbi:MAG: hypothetical protein KC931_26325, partial [Candidatus Omnitrophica bacterium]|nr:hypothetical protein [Candidatus Omnitrophota bacterium]